MLNDGVNQYLYDGEGRICAVFSSSIDGMTTMTGYLYDAGGTRVAKGSISAWSCDPALNGFSTTNDYILGLSGEQMTEMGMDASIGGGNTLAWQHSNVWAGGKMVAGYDYYGPSLHFNLEDPLGTKRVVANILGEPDEMCTSLPFGNDLSNPRSVSCQMESNTLDTFSDPSEHHFTGKERDTESGLDYFGARYMASSMGRFMSPDWSVKAEPVPYAKLDNPQTLNLYAYVGNNPLSRFDPDGHCADHYKDGSCKVNVDPKTGDAGAKAGKQLEGVLNKYDKAINALGDKSKFDIKDSKGNVVGSLTGSEIKGVWNGTSFNVTSQTNFGNGGAGGGTGGTWSGDSFKGNSNLSPGAVSAYANAASDRNEAPTVGLNTLTFHELGHETHYGESLTQKYPVTPTISWPREYGASSAGSRMANTVGAPFDCSIPGGCQ